MPLLAWGRVYILRKKQSSRPHPVSGASAQFTVWLFDYGKQLFETTFLWRTLVVFFQLFRLFPISNRMGEKHRCAPPFENGFGTDGADGEYLVSYAP